MAVEDNIVADVLHRLQDENFVEARQAKRQPAAYRLTQDDIRIDAMRREYFKVTSRRTGTHGSATQAQSKEVPTSPRTSRALFETPSRRDSRRKRANTNDGRDSDESTKRRAINDGRDVRETTLPERTVLLQQTPRRSPRIAGMLLRKEFASFQCEKVFQLSEDFETPPSSA
ncbi:hypothetical protein B9Z65_5810 [Elsinoe australis]|uniref:Uncharacterized protein n=1 Tax=Elsinoe australis TaxID=40998 RepID=A0A2P7YJ80_9PEZI|nr:hypothetical protein B9Z65_5810 [Elsinoe australis]